MRLWLTRDERGCGHDGTMLWQSNDPPVSTLGIWVFAKDDGTYLGSIEYDQKPGTCTELYTEREVRERDWLVHLSGAVGNAAERHNQVATL